MTRGPIDVALLTKIQQLLGRACSGIERDREKLTCTLHRVKKDSSNHFHLRRSPRSCGTWCSLLLFRKYQHRHTRQDADEQTRLSLSCSLSLSLSLSLARSFSLSLFTLSLCFRRLANNVFLDLRTRYNKIHIHECHSAFFSFCHLPFLSFFCLP